MCNCKQATRLVSERLDRRLTLLESLRLKLHLTVCGRCQEYADQLQLIDTMCEQVNEEEHFAGQPCLSEECRQRLRVRLAEKMSSGNNLTNNLQLTFIQ